MIFLNAFVHFFIRQYYDAYMHLLLLLLLLL